MYRSFYQLDQQPFRINTDPGFLWLGESHKEALANLTYGLQEGNGFLVLTGDVGTGKTTLVNALVASLGDDVLVADITHPKLDTIEFLSMVVRTFDASATFHGKADMLLFLKDFLRRKYAEGRRVLLVIDEAHRLSVDLLEEVRLWSNLEHNGQRLIQIFFVGQSELKQILSSSACLALRQRITLFHHLEPLSQSELTQYVAHRLRVAGTERQIFSDAALRQVRKLSGGYPRRINIICDRALLTGYVKAITVIDADTVLECAREVGVLDPKVRLLERVERFVDIWRHRWTQMKVAPRLKGFLVESGRKIWSSGIRMAEGVRSRANQLHRAAVDRLHPSRPIGRQLVLMAALTAGLALLIFWPYGMPERGDQPLVSRDAVDDEVDGEGHSLLSDAEKLTYLFEFSHFTPRISILPDIPLALSAPAQEERAMAAVEPATIDGPSTIELASVALVRSDYQTAIELIEADSNFLTTPGSMNRSLYAKALVGRAEQVMAQSPQTAQQLLFTAIEAAPERAEAYALKGKLHTLSKEYALAITAYKEAVAIDPGQADALFNLGYIYASTGMLEEAESVLRRVVALKPSYLDKALFNLAVVQHKQGNVDQSIEHLESALEIDPENDKVRVYLQQLKDASR